jgi:hypothetical protein
MIITYFQLLLFTYVASYWIIFPLFTKKGTGYFRSVFATHVVLSPILLLLFYGVLLGLGEL